MKLYSLEKLKILFTLIFTLTTCQSLKYHLKSTWDLTVDTKLLFNDHINEKIGQAIKDVGLLRKLQCFLPRSSLLTIYKSFIRPNLDYGDVMYDQPSNATFSSKIVSIQHNVAFAITGANMLQLQPQERLEAYLEKNSTRN